MADKTYAQRGMIAVGAGVALVVAGVAITRMTQTPMVTVVAVKTAMPAGTVLQPADLVSVSIPQPEAQAMGAIPYAAASQTATGQFLLSSSVQPGEILVQPMVTQHKAAPVPAAGLVAMNFPLAQAAGVGFYSGERVAVVGVPGGGGAASASTSPGGSSASGYLPVNKAIVFIRNARIVAVYSQNNTQIDTIGGGQSAQAAQVEMTGAQFQRLLAPMGQGWNLELVANTGGLVSGKAKAASKPATSAGGAGGNAASGGTAAASTPAAGNGATTLTTAP